MAIDSMRTGVLPVSIQDLNNYSNMIRDVISRGSNEKYSITIKNNFSNNKARFTYTKILSIYPLNRFGGINKKKYLRILFEPLSYKRRVYPFKISTELSQFENITEFIDLYRTVFPYVESLRYLLESIPTEIHFKADIYDRDFDFFKNHFCHRDPRKSYIYCTVYNYEIISRTLYLNNSFYFYHKKGRDYVRCEFRVKRHSAIKEQFQIETFYDLLSKNNIRPKFMELLTQRVNPHKFFDCLNPSIKVKPSWNHALEQFQASLLINAPPEISSGEEYLYNCYNAQKSMINKDLLNGKFVDRLESKFELIDYNLGNKFVGEFERFFENYNLNRSSYGREIWF